MSNPFTLAQQLKYNEALAPAADAAGRNGAWVSLKNCSKLLIEVHVDQGNAATIALTLEQATNVSGGSGKAFSAAVPIWANQDLAAGDALTAQTPAASFTTSAAVKHKAVIFEVDPALLDLENGFDCMRVVTGASNVANITSARYWGVGLRYAQAAPPSAIAN